MKSIIVLENNNSKVQIEEGELILYDTLGHLELSVYQQIDIADHVLVIGKVEDLSINNEKDPLIYYRSRYREIK